MSRISTYYRGDMLFETGLGQHKVLVDVPATMGGQDRAPTPPEYFIASLGSCVAALVASYCDRAKINATGLSVHVDFDKADRPTRLTNINITITLPYGQTLNKEEAIRRVAEHCPVHETMLTLEGVHFEIVDQTTLDREVIPL